MAEEGYPEIEDLEEDELETNVERQREAQENVYDDTLPSAGSKDDLFTLFWKVFRAGDSSKVGNLEKNELGELDLTVRDCQKIALLGETLGHPGFARFFWDQAQVTLRTSSSKKGWFTELFVSQKKFATKSRDTPNVQNLLNQPQKKKSFWRR
jgi:hypothetical protein